MNLRRGCIPYAFTPPCASKFLAGPNFHQTYELFDNVCLMAEGMVIYHGKREDIVPYFNNLG